MIKIDLNVAENFFVLRERTNLIYLSESGFQAYSQAKIKHFLKIRFFERNNQSIIYFDVTSKS